MKMKKEDNKRFVITVEKRIHAILKMRAIKSGITLECLINSILEDFLEKGKKGVQR